MSIWELSSLGTEFAIIFIGFVFGGNYLDGSLGISPFGILGGCIMGFTLSLMHIIKRTKEFQNKNSDK